MVEVEVKDNPYKLVEAPIGAYVDYNAGDWTEEDLQLIKEIQKEIQQ